MITISDWKSFFPFKEVRKEQEQAINFILNSFLNNKKKYVIAELGTGTGKSAIAITVARFLKSYNNDENKSYFLTTQKVLQDQYIKDFGNQNGDLKLLKSAGSYICKMLEDSHSESSCAEIQRLLKLNAPVSKVFTLCNESCKFKIAKHKFHESFESITNYSYFLTSSTYTNEIKKRALLVLDEAHNIEEIVSNFIKISFSNYFYKTILNVQLPHVNANQETIFNWLINTCRPRLKEVILAESKKINKSDDSKEALTHAKYLEKLKRNFSKIEHFASNYNHETWVLDKSKTDKRGERIYEFKPINVGEYCYSSLYDKCHKILFLSATILDNDVYCDSIGIDKLNSSFIQIPSPFLNTSKPVHYVPVGSMSKKAIDSTLPKLAEIVKMLLEQHKTEKGIIHCVNYRISNYLATTLKDSRLLTHNSEDREEVIKFHMSSKYPTVLLSPSMMEGVDLADNFSRFQILCKIPFPYLGDAAVQKKMKLNKNWYNYQTVKSVVQSLGRSVRNENDYAVSYILDKDWERFYNQTKKMFPSEFSLSIVDNNVLL